ncbi:uncharacterized protein DS421_14g471450 [Arachis hypogaea]|nr:uncharacterized protein DS421_14g471450 [Arachis hypogaea]
MHQDSIMELVSLCSHQLSLDPSLSTSDFASCCIQESEGPSFLLQSQIHSELNQIWSTLTTPYRNNVCEVVRDFTQRKVEIDCT